MSKGISDNEMEFYDNLAKYKIFLTVAECKSISKAATQLYLSQPAVSMTIKKLEESLNTTLFLRKPKGVVLTENGRVLYESARTALNMLSDVEENLRCPDNTGYLRIAASNVLCKYILMPYLKDFTGRYPNTDVSITCTSSANACKMVENCSIDLALAAKPENMGTMQYHSLGVIEYIFVCTPAYRKKLGCRNDEIFANGNIMLLNKDNISRVHINSYYAQNNIIPSHILEVNDMALLIEFAKIGIGISCVVKQFVKKELDDGILIENQLPSPVPSREIGFMYQRIKPFNENITRFLTVNSNLQRKIAPHT